MVIQQVLLLWLLQVEQPHIILLGQARLGLRQILKMSITLVRACMP